MLVHSTSLQQEVLANDICSPLIQQVVLEDIGSKYGTFLNAGILTESQRLAESSSGKVSSTDFFLFKAPCVVGNSNIEIEFSKHPIP